MTLGLIGRVERGPICKYRFIATRDDKKRRWEIFISTPDGVRGRPVNGGGPFQSYTEAVRAIEKLEEEEHGL